MTDSWWLKVKRAQKHMVDIQREARSYASHHPYEFIRIRRPDSKGDVRYRVRITEQPDPMIAVMLGDFVHNLRSALDYIIVASVPKQRRKNASFPFIFEDIWAKDADGQFVVNDANRREDFETAVRGLHPKARALVIQAQPYRIGAEAYRHILGAISRLENADKHRELVVVGGGVLNPIAVWSIRGETFTPDLQWLPRNMFAIDGTIIGWELPANRRAPDGTVIQASEVDMQFTGTAEILIKITRIGGNQPPADFRLGKFMLMALNDVRRVIRFMEPFVMR